MTPTPESLGFSPHSERVWTKLLPNGRVVNLFDDCSFTNHNRFSVRCWGNDMLKYTGTLESCHAALIAWLLTYGDSK